MFSTTLGDLSTSPYAVLGDYADHRAGLYSQPCSGTHQSLPTLYSGLASIILRPQLEDCSSQLHMNWTHIQPRGKFKFFRPCYKALTLPSSKFGDYIGTMHLAMHLSIKISTWTFLFNLGTTCLRHLLTGSGTKWAHFTLR